MNSLERKPSEEEKIEKIPADPAGSKYVYNAELEKKLLWKIDLRLVPMVMIMVSICRPVRCHKSTPTVISTS